MHAYIKLHSLNSLIPEKEDARQRVQKRLNMQIVRDRVCARAYAHTTNNHRYIKLSKWDADTHVR